MRVLSPSSMWIEENVSNVLVPPILYNAPAEGWLAWATKITGVKAPGQGTISGDMNEANAPNWAQYTGLKAALLGFIENPGEADLGKIIEPRLAPLAQAVIAWDKQDDARLTRQAFEGGWAMPITTLASIERFTSFVPVVRPQNAGNYYTAGDTTGKQHTFVAANHAVALGKSAEWFSQPGDTYDKTGVRGQEIAARRALADKQTKDLPPIYLDLAQLQLHYDQILYNENNDICARLNGSHGYYIVTSERWCYVLKITVGPASRLAILSALEDKTKLFLQPEDLAIFAQLEGWESDNDGGYQWRAGQGRAGQVQSLGNGQWKLVFGGKPTAILVVEGRKIRAIGHKKKVLAESLGPKSWGDTVEPLLAWGTWRVIKSKNE